MTIAKWTVERSPLWTVLVSGAAHASCRPMAAAVAAAAVIVLAFEGQCSWFQQKWQRVYLQSQIGT